MLLVLFSFVSKKKCCLACGARALLLYCILRSSIVNLETSLNFKLFQQCNYLFYLPFGTLDLEFLKFFGLNICKYFLPNLLVAYDTPINWLEAKSKRGLPELPGLTIALSC